MYLHGNRKLTLEILDLMSRLEKIAQVRYAGGLAAQQDVIRAQVEQTNMRSELVTLDSEARQVNARLNALLARPAPAPLAEPTLARPWPAPAQLEFSALEERVRSRNPQLFAEEARIKSAEKGRDLAYKNRYPDFTLGDPADAVPDLASRNGTLMLEVNIPLQQETRRAQERESEAMLAAARSRKEAAANQVLADLSENLAGIEAARRIETLATTSLLPQAELTFKSALAGYETGKVDFATLLDAQRARSARPGKTRSRPRSRGRSGWLKSKNSGRRSMKQATGLAYRRRRDRARWPRAAATGWATGGAPRRPWRKRGHERRQRAGGRRRKAGKETALLPQPDGPARHLADAEKRPDGHGLHRGLCGRRRERAGCGRPDPDQHREGPEARRAHRGGPLCARWTGRCAPPAASSPTSAASMPSRRSSRAMSSACIVNVTGQPVSKGQPLFEVYSPELVSAQREYAIAMQGVASLKDAGGEAQAGMQQLAESSLQRLRNWDISDEQIKALASSGEARRTLTFRSPASGIVTEKKALQGMRFMPGEALYQVADLSSVWVIADVFEQDIGLVKTGATARVRINAYPDKTFEGTVTYVYPTLKAETRTVPVRVELANPGMLLKPAMFAQVELPVSAQRRRCSPCRCRP